MASSHTLLLLLLRLLGLNRDQVLLEHLEIWESIFLSRHSPRQPNLCGFYRGQGPGQASIRGCLLERHTRVYQCFLHSDPGQSRQNAKRCNAAQLSRHRLPYTSIQSSPGDT